jgi:hypothetical protein
MKIKASEAIVKTASVEIKALTVEGKQMTLAVFRQLEVEQLISEDGSLRGVPWGRVNYLRNSADELHVVWQKGDELRRCLVTPYPPSDVLRQHEARVSVRRKYADLCAWAYALSEVVSGARWPTNTERCLIRYADTQWVPSTNKLQLTITPDERKALGEIYPFAIWVGGDKYEVNMLAFVRDKSPEIEMAPLMLQIVMRNTEAEGSPSDLFQQAVRDFYEAKSALDEIQKAFSQRYEELKSLPQLFIAV